jgi:hypothetical protein
LSSVDITLNTLDFGALDEVTGIATNSTYSFNPQSLLLEETSLIVESTSDVELDRLVGGTGNLYQWFKDGNEVQGEIDPSLGIFHCHFLFSKYMMGLITWR